MLNSKANALMTALLLWSWLIHLAVDWFAQTEWQALNKVRWTHPAAWVHSGLHTLAQLLIFPWYVALAIGLVHLWIDTRTPLIAWRKLFRQTQEGPMLLHLAIWQDQVSHVLVLAVASVLVAHHH